VMASPGAFDLGHRVMVRGTETGSVSFIGETNFARGCWVGITMDEGFEGKNDGSVNGVRYFSCPPGRGVFVRFPMVRKAPLLNSRKARLRVVILNVRGWVSAHGHSSVKAVADELQKIDADVVSLCEVHDRDIVDADGLGPKQVGMNVLDFLAEATGLIHHAFHSDGSQFGNALLSLFPFASPPVAHELRSGSVLVLGDILWHPEYPPVCFGAVRLHHTSEALRMEQLEAVVGAMKGAAGESGHMLLGTLNALRVEDYSELEWKALEEDYAYHGFGDFESNPQGQAMALLDEEGYEDAFVHCGKGPMATYRWRDVRYDYIMASEDFPHKMRHCRRIDSDTSDHFALYVDLRLDTAGGPQLPDGQALGDTGAGTSAVSPLMRAPSKSPLASP